MARSYRVGEVAEMTGVSIRTLHHYDEIGLLRPARRAGSGHRRYVTQDLLRLQQILTLRYLGFSLARIAELLERPDFDLVASLRAQRQALRDRVDEIRQIEGVLDALLADHQTGGAWDWTLVNRLTQSVQNQLDEKGTQMERYYTPEQLARFAELREQLPAEEIQAVEEGWAELLADMRASGDLDPASPEAQAFVQRWDELLERTRRGYAGYEDLWQAIGQNYAAGNFEADQRAPDQSHFALIEAARAAGNED